MEKMKVFQKDPDSYLHVKNDVQFKQKAKPKLEHMDTSECLQVIPTIARIVNKSPKGQSSRSALNATPGEGGGGTDSSDGDGTKFGTPSRYSLPKAPVRNCEPGATSQPINRLLTDLKSDENPDPRIVLLKFLEDNVWMIHDIIEQQIMLMVRQAEIKSITTGEPIPSMEELVSKPEEFSQEQSDAFERLVLRFDSALANRRRNLKLFCQDHSWVLEAEIKRHKNCISVEECNYDDGDSSAKTDLAGLMTSVFGNLNLGSC